MSEYIGTAILDTMLSYGIDSTSVFAEPQEYRSFFGDEICTRLLAMDDIHLNYNDLFYRYLGMENDITFWGCDVSDVVICVDESRRIFITQPASIVRERNIDGLDNELTTIPEESDDQVVPQV